MYVVPTDARIMYKATLTIAARRNLLEQIDNLEAYCSEHRRVTAPNVKSQRVTGSRCGRTTRRPRLGVLNYRKT